MMRTTDRSAAVIRPPGFIALFVICTLLGSLSFARYASQAGGDLEVWSSLPFWLACYYPWVALAPAVFALERRYPLGGARRYRNVGVLAAGSVPFSITGFALAALLTAGMRKVASPSDAVGTGLPASASYDLFAHQLFFWTCVGVGYACRTLAKLQDHERAASRLALEKSQLEGSLRKAELEVLRMRLNPHFLFNTIQNISVLVGDDPETANLMLLRLSEVIRAAFRREYSSEVTLREEIRITRAYLDIEQLRFGDRLSVVVDIDPATEDALVPTLLLQPLVENSIRHGLRSAARPGEVLIRSRAEDDSLVLLVSDNGAGLPGRDVEYGVGLGSTVSRLERMYPGRSALRVQDAVGSGTETHVALPLRFAGEPGEVQHA